MIRNGGYPTNKEILLMLGVGTLLTASIVMPGLGIAAGAIIKAKRKHDWKENQKEWKKFNAPLLRRNLKRLYENKFVEVINKNGQEIIKLTQKGQTKYLRYKMEDWFDNNEPLPAASSGVSHKSGTSSFERSSSRSKLRGILAQNKGWDGKWRLVIYDISKLKKNHQENFRRVLKSMNFWPLQESVYLTPYKCQEVVEYLKEYFNIGEEVILLEISKLENESHYKQYFISNTLVFEGL